VSKVAIKGNASGTGTFTLEAPNSNTDRTLTLPDEAGTVLTSGTDVANFPSGFANGITEADQFRLTTDLTTPNGTISTNLERTDDASFAKIGTGMSESSGIFTFPTTGLYQIIMVGRITPASNDSAANLYIEATIDNSNWDILGFSTSGASTGGPTHSVSSTFFVNVTNTSNVKVRFLTGSFGTGGILGGSTDNNRTHFTFIRLGDSQ